MPPGLALPHDRVDILKSEDFMRRLCSIAVIGLLFVSTGEAHPYDERAAFVYLALGASDATGVGAASMANGYVFLIKQELEKLDLPVVLINRGVAGARANVVKEEVRHAKEAHDGVDLVTIWVGTNDLVHGDDPDDFGKALHAILQMLRKHVARTIVIANLPDLTRLPRFRNQPSPHVTDDRIAAYNAVIAEEAGAAGALLVDLFAQIPHDDLLLHPDGFHPNDAGHREIAAFFLEAIRPVVKAPLMGSGARLNRQEHNRHDVKDTLSACY
jgi:lysophospholipase L1-like esterase